jgi:hypothetical protein
MIANLARRLPELLQVRRSLLVRSSSLGLVWTSALHLLDRCYSFPISTAKGVSVSQSPIFCAKFSGLLVAGKKRCRYGFET